MRSTNSGCGVTPAHMRMFFHVYILLDLLLLSLVFAVLSFCKLLDSPVDKPELEYKMAEEALKLVEKEYKEGNEYCIAQYWLVMCRLYRIFDKEGFQQKRR